MPQEIGQDAAANIDGRSGGNNRLDCACQSRRYLQPAPGGSHAQFALSLTLVAAGNETANVTIIIPTLTLITVVKK